MAELVELQYRIVKIRELEVGGDYIRVRVVCGVLYGSEVVYLVLLGYNDDAAGVLTCGTLDTYKLCNHMRGLGLGYLYLALLEVFAYISPCGLIGKSTDGSRTEHVSFTEELLGVFMNSTLYVTREVKVDIRGFITLEAKEGFEGDVLSVREEGLTADGTSLIGQVKAGADRAVGKELGVLTLGTSIMGWEGVNLRDTRHRCNK